MEQKNRLEVKRGELQAVMAHEKFEVDKAKALGQEITTLHSKLMELHMAKKSKCEKKASLTPQPAAAKGAGQALVPLVQAKKGPAAKGPICSKAQ